MATPASKPDEPESDPDLQILICTHNRVTLLARTLDSLNACERPADCRVGIFIVANACSDGTAALLDDYRRHAEAKNRLPLRWIEEPRPGKSRALNLALPQLSAPIIALVDDDQRAGDTYLGAICTAANRYPEADLFCGRMLPDWDGSEPAWIHDRGRYRIYPLPVPHFDLGSDPRVVEPGTVTPSGGNVVMRRELFDRVGPFSLELGPRGHNLGGAEDVEWMRRALAGGARLQYIPEMIQYHYVDPARLTVGYLMRKAYERSASTTQLAGDPKGRRLPLYMYRKVVTYLGSALFSVSARRRRFYLIRLAAALGETRGFLSRRQVPTQTARTP